MVRITTNSSMIMYKSGLMKTTNKVNTAMSKLMTYRNFDSYAADPASATRAFKVHSSINSVQAQHSNTETLISKNETAWTNMENIVDDLTRTMGLVPAFNGLNATNLEVLDTQALALEEGAAAIILSMNSRYNNDYIFAGADNHESPFSIVEETAGGVTSKYVTYRGVKVDHDLGADYIDPTTGTTVTNPATGANYTNEEKLDEWNVEKLLVDIGLGFEVDAAGNVIDATAYDASISGIDFLGYGVDADGDPKNTASIMLRMADVFNAYDSSSATPWGPYSEDDALRLMGKMQDAHSSMVEKHSELSAKTQYLETNLSQLESTHDALNLERASIEDIDMADAIEQFMWAQTAYNAALQVGTQVIPQSLMDYMS